MSTEIVSEICPPPEWNLTAEDIQQMVVELEDFYQIFKPGFGRCDQAAHGWVYLKGLLSDLPRKVTERIALRFGTCVRSLQHFIGQSPWEREWLLEKQQALVVATLGEADGVVLVDESGMPKQGDHSVGVASQYCGSLGKVANAQVGVYLGYASRQGHSFLDGRLFLPEQWFATEYQDLRQACGVPPEQGYQTKPEIGLELLHQALQRGDLPFQWVAADELYGDSPVFRDGIASLNKWFFVEVRCTTGA
jgi:SRSO17 transposase